MSTTSTAWSSTNDERHGIAAPGEGRFPASAAGSAAFKPDERRTTLSLPRRRHHRHVDVGTQLEAPMLARFMDTDRGFCRRRGQGG